MDVFDSKVKYGDRIVVVDDKTGLRTPEGDVFEIDMGTVTVIVNRIQMNFNGQTLKGKTMFGPCTIEIVNGKNMCSNCKSRGQTGKYCSNCGNLLNKES
jgi:hypothetical protein